MRRAVTHRGKVFHTKKYADICVSTDLFSDLAGHLFSKVPVLTDSVEQLATLHHLHNNQEPRSVKNKTGGVCVRGNGKSEEMD